MNTALDAVLDTIVTELDNGVAPWRQPYPTGAELHFLMRSTGNPVVDAANNGRVR